MNKPRRAEPDATGSALVGHGREGESVQPCPDVVRAAAEPADYQRTRGGAGSPWPSCHEITGLRSTPILSISASITSPGLR